MKLTFTEIARRLTGFQTPLFGISWTPPASDRESIRKLITFLEDRRVLYQDHHREITPHVTRSVLEIRDELTRTLQELSEDSAASPSIRAMRAACRRFLDETTKWHRDYMEPPIWMALGELRGQFGLHLAQLCVKYGIDVESEIASILPPALEEGGSRVEEERAHELGH